MRLVEYTWKQGEIGAFISESWNLLHDLCFFKTGFLWPLGTHQIKLTWKMGFWGKVFDLSRVHKECLVQSDHFPIFEDVQLPGLSGFFGGQAVWIAKKPESFGLSCAFISDLVGCGNLLHIKGEDHIKQLQLQLQSLIYFNISNMGVSKNSGIPKWMVKIMENPIF